MNCTFESTMRPRFLPAFWFSLLVTLLVFAVTLDSPVLAQGKSGNAPGKNQDKEDDDGGSDNGGSDDGDGSDPGIRYEVQVFLPPADSASSLSVRGSNNSSQVIGNYTITLEDDSYTWSAWIYDPLLDPGVAHDLNDLTTGVPAGLWIRHASAINDSGLVAVYSIDLNQEDFALYPGVVDTRGYQYHPIPTPDDLQGMAVDVNNHGDVAVFMRTDFSVSEDFHSFGIFNHGLIEEGDLTNELVTVDIPLSSQIRAFGTFLSDVVDGEMFVVTNNADYDPIRFEVFSGSLETLESDVTESGTDTIFDSPDAANRLGDFSGKYLIREYHHRNGRILSADRRIYLHTSVTEVDMESGLDRVSDLNSSRDILGAEAGSDPIWRSTLLLHRERGRFSITSLIDETTDDTGLFAERISWGGRRLSERDLVTDFPVVVGTFALDEGAIGPINRYGALLIPFVPAE